MIAAIVIAVVADVVQFAAGFVGWFVFDQVVDIIAMLIMMRLLGFHWLLLPTFILEFVPFVEMFPTWTGCVLLVVRLRTRQQKALKELSKPVHDSTVR